ncbi:MAG: O-antigen ligase family protein, partial [Planctomycetota bacterium]
IIRSPILEPHWLLGACAALVLYISFTRLIVPYPMDNTTSQYRNLLKVIFVMVLLTGLASDLRRYRALYIVVALSVAFWAIKGGLKVLFLGPHQVYGKTYDNNYFALTSVMTLPMVFYFAMSVKHTRWRSVLLAASGLICLAVIGSRSRAGFVAFAVVLFCMAWSSRYRLRAMFAVLLFSGAAMALSGGEIRDRIDSILAFRTDRSASSRFATWDVAIELLKQNPVLGVGFNNFEVAKDTFVGGRKAAHNIFLQNLAELGIIGHPIWLMIVVGSLVSAYMLMRWARRLPSDMRWAYYWSRGLMLGQMAFCIHGFFHNEEYLEQMFVMVGLIVALQVVVRRELYRQKLEASRGAPVVEAPVESTKPAKQRAWHPGELVPV